MRVTLCAGLEEECEGNVTGDLEKVPETSSNVPEDSEGMPKTSSKVRGGS